MADLPLIYTVTQSGRIVDLLKPDPATISLRDIAVHLARLNRYGGACPAYSVAQHSCLVAGLLLDEHPEDPIIGLYGLLHDAHEAYLGDVIRPVKRLRARLAGTDLDTALATRFDAAIHEALGLPWPIDEVIAQAVHHADMVAFVTEWRDLMPKGSPHGLAGAPEPRPKEHVTAAGEHEARETFLRFAGEFAYLGRLTDLLYLAMEARAVDAPETCWPVPWHPDFRLTGECRR